MEFDKMYQTSNSDAMDDFELRFGTYEPKMRSNTQYTSVAQDAWDMVQDKMYADIEYVQERAQNDMGIIQRRAEKDIATSIDWANKDLEKIGFKNNNKRNNNDKNNKLAF